jgi:hypothetical protein
MGSEVVGQLGSLGVKLDRRTLYTLYEAGRGSSPDAAWFGDGEGLRSRGGRFAKVSSRQPDRRRHLDEEASS